MSDNIKIIKGRDFTPSKLKQYLNNNFGSKKTGKRFTNADIYQYQKRGYLPEIYGNLRIKVIHDKDSGIKILRIEDN